jgi:hypothetical protein
LNSTPATSKPTLAEFLNQKLAKMALNRYGIAPQDLENTTNQLAILIKTQPDYTGDPESILVHAFIKTGMPNRLIIAFRSRYNKQYRPVFRIRKQNPPALFNELIQYVQDCYDKMTKRLEKYGDPVMDPSGSAKKFDDRSNSVEIYERRCEGRAA